MSDERETKTDQAELAAAQRALMDQRAAYQRMRKSAGNAPAPAEGPAEGATVIPLRARSGQPERIGVGMSAYFQKLAEKAANFDPTKFEEWQERERDRKRRSFRYQRNAWIEEHSGIPPKIVKVINAKAVDESVEAIVETLREIASGAKLVILLGKAGTGKTLAACWALYQQRLKLEEQRVDDEYDRPIGNAAGKFCSAFRFTRVPTWEQAARAENETNFLVLDDIGREASDKKGDIEELLFNRYDNDLVTIATANLETAELQTHYDGRLISRILEVGHIIELTEVLRPVR